VAWHRHPGRQDRERVFLAVLCVAAAFRVFFFAAAFPLFNNVDEHGHVDLVLKYSRGHLPSTGVEDYGRESAEMFVRYGTPEYLVSKAGHPDLRPPPPRWTYAGIESTAEFQRAVESWTRRPNHEAASFPVYYALAGAWCTAGRMLGLAGGHLLYWVRFLDVPLLVLLVWVCWRIGRDLFPDRPAMRLGLPLLAAFHPQDVFHSINSDALSPLLFATSLRVLLAPGRLEQGHGRQIAAGLAVAATFLVKPSNIAVAVVLGVVVITEVCRIARGGEPGRTIPQIVTLLAAASLPVALWLARNYVTLGSVTGTAEKIRLLTWTAKPFGEMWDHPIFSAHGAAYFLGGVTTTFWRGEVVWFLEPLSHAPMDRFYVASSACLLVLSLPTLWRIGRADSPGARIVGFCFLSVAISLAFLATISIVYDFGRCWAPSREHPYFLAGRLVSGALVPFLVLYLDGVERLTSPLRSRVPPLAVVAAIVTAITVSELALAAPVLRSPYNWFHML
jgi:hypothetical protein